MGTPLVNKNMIWVQPDKLLYDKMILTKMIVCYAILRHCVMGLTLFYMVLNFCSNLFIFFYVYRFEKLLIKFNLKLY